MYGGNAQSTVATIDTRVSACRSGISSRSHTVIYEGDLGHRMLDKKDLKASFIKHLRLIHCGTLSRYQSDLISNTSKRY